MHIVSETIKKASTRGGMLYLGDNFVRIKWHMCCEKKSGIGNTGTLRVKMEEKWPKLGKYENTLRYSVTLHAD